MDGCAAVIGRVMTVTVRVQQWLKSSVFSDFVASGAAGSSGRPSGSIGVVHCSDISDGNGSSPRSNLRPLRTRGDRCEGAAMTLELTSSPPSAVRSFDDDERLPDGTGRLITALIVGVPFLALAVGVVSLWGRGIGLRDVLLAVTFYFLTGHGMSIGFHRLLAHKSFSARRPLKVVVVACGSMAFEGGPISWVANHRRHHVFSDTADDPHSPHHHGGGVGWRAQRAVARPRGLAVHGQEHLTAAPRGRPAGRPRHRGDRRAVPVVVRRLARLAVRSRLVARRVVRGCRRARCSGPVSSGSASCTT